MALQAGDWVEVRSRDEILATLDASARLDGLPFMPEMLPYCGKRFRVWKRAHKTCDTVNKTGGRSMPDAVHLEGLRCDGGSHGGCGAACLLFWKEAWLRRIDEPAGVAVRREDTRSRRETGCSESQLHAACGGGASGKDAVYSCQATCLPEATTLLPWWDPRQYVEDWTSGNTSIGDLVGGAVYVGYQKLVNRSAHYSKRFSTGLVRMYDVWQGLVGGVPYPRRQGVIPAGQTTPSCALDLQPGELVQIRPYREILETLDTNNKNRGLYFDAEEVPYCGKVYPVRSKVSRIINEKTGKMIQLKDNNVILEGVICRGHYSDRRMHCPRAIYPIWRETWLIRADGTPDSSTGSDSTGQLPSNA